MQDHERIKLILDAQYYKDQLDICRVELAQKSKQLDELRNIRQMYEDLHSTEEDRVKHEIADNFKKRVALESRKVTFLGHLRYQIGNQTVFSEVTSRYLDVTDIIKLLALSKTCRATALKFNSSLFCEIYSHRISQLSFRVKEWTDHNSSLRRQIGLLEAKEKARSQMLQNVTDQRIRAIIEKHVIKPILGHSAF